MNRFSRLAKDVRDWRETEGYRWLFIAHKIYAWYIQKLQPIIKKIKRQEQAIKDLKAQLSSQWEEFREKYETRIVFNRDNECDDLLNIAYHFQREPPHYSRDPESEYHQQQYEPYFIKMPNWMSTGLIEKEYNKLPEKVHWGDTIVKDIDGNITIIPRKNRFTKVGGFAKSTSVPMSTCNLSFSLPLSEDARNFLDKYLDYCSDVKKHLMCTCNVDVDELCFVNNGIHLYFHFRKDGNLRGAYQYDLKSYLEHNKESQSNYGENSC